MIQTFFTTFIKLKLNLTLKIKCFFTNQYFIIFFFVDNIVIIYNRHHMHQFDIFQTQLFKTYEMRYLKELK